MSSKSGLIIGILAAAALCADYFPSDSGNVWIYRQSMHSNYLADSCIGADFSFKCDWDTARDWWVWMNKPDSVTATGVPVARICYSVDVPKFDWGYPNFSVIRQPDFDSYKYIHNDSIFKIKAPNLQAAGPDSVEFKYTGIVADFKAPIGTRILSVRYPYSSNVPCTDTLFILPDQQITTPFGIFTCRVMDVHPQISYFTTCFHGGKRMILFFAADVGIVKFIGYEYDQMRNRTYCNVYELRKMYWGPKASANSGEQHGVRLLPKKQIDNTAVAYNVLGKRMNTMDSRVASVRILYSKNGAWMRSVAN